MAIIEGNLAAFSLIFEAADVRGQQAVKAEGVALGLSKRGAFVEARIQQEIEAGEASANDGGVAGGGWGNVFIQENLSLLFFHDS
jgi:hypothetical protein